MESNRDFEGSFSSIMNSIMAFLNQYIKISGNKSHHIDKKTSFFVSMKSVFDEINDSMKYEDIETVRKKFLYSCDEIFNKTFNIDKITKNDISNYYCDTQDIKQNEKKEESFDNSSASLDIEKAKVQLQKNAFLFGDICESLYRLLDNPKLDKERADNISNELKIRIRSLQNSKELIQYLDELFDDNKSIHDDRLLRNLKEFMDFMFMCGFKRDNTQTVIISESTYIHYIDCDDEPLLEGNEMKVISPYWYIGNEVLQRGLLTKMINK